MGTLIKEQVDGLVSAVHKGTGFAGWRGGPIATFGDSRDSGPLWAVR
ncbi:hypothetical protein [Planotetraspora sp. GP83]